MIRFITTILFNIIVTLTLFYVFIFSKTVLLEEGIYLEKDLTAQISKIILSENSQLN
jgi:hypothetical protein